jgi:hypothetical protein
VDSSEIAIVSTAATQHGVFAASQFDDLTDAVIHNRLRQRRWERQGPGVFSIAGTPSTWERDLWIALLTAGDGARIGRRSALRIDGLTRRFGDAIDVVQPEPTTPRTKPRTSRRTSRLLDRHVTVVDGFPITTIERSLFDLAGLTSPLRRRRGMVYVPEATVERLVDDAIVRDRTTVSRLTRVFLDLAGRGRPGTALMRRLLEHRSESFVPTESELEDLFVAFVERYGLPLPKRQVTLGSKTEQIGRVDFLYERAKLVVEVDGHAFHEQRQVQRNDRRRDLQLLRSGWRVVRFSWLDLREDGPAIAELLLDIVNGPAG